MDIRENTTRYWQERVRYLEGMFIPHARKQEHANGFQAGWHAVLDRLAQGDAPEQLRALIPDSRTAAFTPAEPPQQESEGNSESLKETCRCGHPKGGHVERFEQRRGEKWCIEKCAECPCESYLQKGGPMDMLVESFKRVDTVPVAPAEPQTPGRWSHEWIEDEYDALVTGDAPTALTMLERADLAIATSIGDGASLDEIAAIQRAREAVARLGETEQPTDRQIATLMADILEPPPSGETEPLLYGDRCHPTSGRLLSASPILPAAALDTVSPEETYWANALDLVADELDKLAPADLEARRHKLIGVLRNAAFRCQQPTDRPSLDALRMLEQGWRKQSIKESQIGRVQTNEHRMDRHYARSGIYRACADELDALLSGGEK